MYDWMDGPRYWPAALPAVWLGVSVEDQKWADIRIPALLETPAAVRWLSCEPLLGPIDLAGYLPRPADAKWYPVECRHGHAGCPICDRTLAPADGIGWVVTGGESGPGARPMHPSWARSLRDQCLAAGVPYLFKQWGEWAPAVDLDPDLRERAAEQFAGQDYVCRVGKKRAGRELDGRTWDQYPTEAAI